MNYTYHDALAYYGIGGAHPGGLALTKRILNYENISPNMTILDAGCGTGQTAAFLKKQFNCHVIALDNHKLMLEKAKERFNKENLKISILHGSVEQIPVSNQSFDLILSESVIAFTDVEKTLNEYARILKSSGVLINIDMTSETIMTKEEQENISEVYGIPQVFTEDQWIKNIKKSPFKKVEILFNDTVFSHLNKHSQDIDEQPEFSLSKNIDPELVDILNDHQELTMELSHKLGYRVFRSTF